MSDPAKLRTTFFGQCRRLGIGEAQRREIQMSIGGLESVSKEALVHLKDNGKSALEKLVRHLIERGAVLEKPKTKRRGSRRPVNGGPGTVDRMITPNQRRTIEKWGRWNNLSAAYVRGISKRQCGRDFPQTTREATALILALSKTKKKEPSYDSLPSSP